MKLFKKTDLDKYVSKLLSGDGTVESTLPKLESHFAFITEDDDIADNGHSLNGAVRAALSSEDCWDMMVPTEQGNGVLINIKDSLDLAWPIWGISPNGKVVLYNPKVELKVLSMEEFGRHLCQESGVDTVAYSYPEAFEVRFEATMATEEPSSPLGTILKGIIDETLDKSDVSAGSYNALARLKEEANEEIWGKSDYFILNNGEILVLPQNFGNIMDHADLVCDQIISYAEGTDLAEVVVPAVEDIKGVLALHDLHALQDIQESVEILQDIIPDGGTLEAVNILAGLFK